MLFSSVKCGVHVKLTLMSSTSLAYRYGWLDYRISKYGTDIHQFSQKSLNNMLYELITMWSGLNKMISVIHWTIVKD
jgi:hypothetical protein